MYVGVVRSVFSWLALHVIIEWIMVIVAMGCMLCFGLAYLMLSLNGLRGISQRAVTVSRYPCGLVELRGVFGFLRICFLWLVQFDGCLMAIHISPAWHTHAPLFFENRPSLSRHTHEYTTPGPSIPTRNTGRLSCEATKVMRVGRVVLGRVEIRKCTCAMSRARLSCMQHRWSVTSAYYVGCNYEKGVWKFNIILGG